MSNVNSRTQRKHMRGEFRLFPILLLVATAVLVSACSPSLSPLYRDYKIGGSDSLDQNVQARIRSAFEGAGWQLVESSAANAVATESRTMSRWGLYRVTVSLEAVPIGKQYVRLYFHPYRRYITGGRTKIPYLNSTMRSRLLPDLNEAFENQGLALVGFPFRDQY